MKTQTKAAKIQNQISRYFDLSPEYFTFTIDEACNSVWVVIYGTLMAGTLTKTGVRNDFSKI